jgi:hypothetical protein
MTQADNMENKKANIWLRAILVCASLALAFGAVLYTAHYVAEGDLCRTIFGCFALWTWFNFGKKENTK